MDKTCSDEWGRRTLYDEEMHFLASFPGEWGEMPTVISVVAFILNVKLPVAGCYT